MIYVASPYSDPDPNVREARARATRYWTLHQIVKTNLSLFSPIAYIHEYAVEYELPKDAAFWQQFNEGFIIDCEEMWVLMLPGWDKSVGVKMEIQFCVYNNIPVVYKPYD